MLFLSLAAYAADVHVYSVHRLLPMLDLEVYRGGGLLTLHLGAELHTQRGLVQLGPDAAMDFTYTPFAAVLFALPALLPLAALRWLSWIASLSALAGASG